MKMTRAQKDRELRRITKALLDEALSKNTVDVFEVNLNLNFNLTVTISVGELRKLALLTGARLEAVQKE